MKRSIRILALLLAVLSLLSSVAFAANMTAGEMASKMAGIYEYTVPNSGSKFYYKISPSGDDMLIQGGLKPNNWINNIMLLNDYAVYINDESTLIKFVDSSVTYLLGYQFEILPDGNISMMQAIGVDFETQTLVKISGPDTGDTTNILLPGAMMLFAVVGIAVAVKKREQY